MYITIVDYTQVRWNIILFGFTACQPVCHLPSICLEFVYVRLAADDAPTGQTASTDRKSIHFNFYRRQINARLNIWRTS